MNTIDVIEQEEIAKQERKFPDFRPGDTLAVMFTDGSRLQKFEGLCIARSKHGINASFTVRKISYGEGVERVVPLYSPSVSSIEVLRSGRVRRAKLYYMRQRRGKSARLAERVSYKPKTVDAKSKVDAKAKPKADVQASTT